MNSKQIVLKCITLLYREHQRANNSDHSSDMVHEVLATIKLPEVAIENDRTHHIMSGLKHLAEDMCAEAIGEPFDYDDLRGRLRIVVEDDDALYEAFEISTSEPYEGKELEKTCTRLKSQIRTYLSDFHIKQILGNAGKTAFKATRGTNWREKAAEIAAELEPHLQGGEEIRDPSIVDEVEFDNVEDVARIFRESKLEESAEGIMTTGLQGLNRMMGRERMGLRRGELVCWGGLQHKFKSGFGLMLLAQIALHNEPYLYDKNRRPLLLVMSAENELQQNITWLYQYIKENETGEKVEMTKVDENEAAIYVTEKLQSRGWYVAFVRFDPSDFTYRNVYDEIMKYEGRGYEIGFCLFDYLNMISKRGCNAPSGTGSDIRDLFRRIRNFTSKKKITFATPHQLSTEAKNLLREGRDDFVKEIAEKGYWDGCKTIDNEMDLELYIHIETVGEDNSYLTIQRGKHRKNAITPEKDKYCVYKFNPIGTIPMDIDGKDMSRKSVASEPAGEGGGAAWWA